MQHAPGPHHTLSERDVILNAMFSDIQTLRSKEGSLILHTPISPSFTNPLSPLPAHTSDSTESRGVPPTPRLAERWILLDRLAIINPDLRAALDLDRDHDQVRDLNQNQNPNQNQHLNHNQNQNQNPIESQTQNQHQHQSMRPVQPHTEESDAATRSTEQVFQERSYSDMWWHALGRILFIFSCLNPSIGHVQVRALPPNADRPTRWHRGD